MLLLRIHLIRIWEVGPGLLRPSRVDSILMGLAKLHKTGRHMNQNYAITQCDSNDASTNNANQNSVSKVFS